jgi:hypothetical protein
MKALGLLAAALPVCLFLACSTPDFTGGRCEETEDCYTDINAQPDGSVCADPGLCTCPLGTEECCPMGVPGECVKTCPEEHKCPNDGSDAGDDAECSSDTDCPQPPDARCGAGLCVEGSCTLDIWPGPIPWQYYGDCMRSECDATGVVIEVEDSSDYFNDGNQCTFDYCQGGSHNMEVADGVACPEADEGYCYKGECVECISWMPQANVCGLNLDCDFFWCVPTPQCANDCGGLCAPCGAGSGCFSNMDCLSGNCSRGMCQLPDCDDGKENGEETGVDCGASSCGPCPEGEGCEAHADCASGVCKIGKCQGPTCFDAVQNGDELMPDCGGSACPPCP